MDGLIVSKKFKIHNYTACYILHCNINVKIDNNVTLVLLVHALLSVKREITM